jgi:DNA polymerase (family 10)
MGKDDIAAALDEIGTLLQLKGENDFRVRAYTNGARVVQQLEGDLGELIKSGKLADVRGIGDALFDKIAVLAETGKLPFLEELRAATPPGLVEMLRLPGVGPKKVKAMHDALGIDTIEKLKAACDSGEVAKLKGFGEKTQAKILEGIGFLGQVGQRVRIDLAYALGEALIQQLKALPGVQQAELCGSLRRRRETAKDIDILIASDKPKPIMDAFVKLPEVLQIVGHGETKSSIVAKMSHAGEAVTLNADLRIVTEEQFPYALVYFTGSKEHNIRLRQRAIERGLSLNEYAFTPLAPGGRGAGGVGVKKIKVKSENDIYAALDLEWVPPEMREDTGEIEAAAKKSLPELIVHDDLRGVFHNHTTASDGTASLEAMALAAKKLGWEYFGVADHSQSLNVANGLTEARVRKQWEEADALNTKLKGIRILKGTESDILLDGSLDYPDEFLEGFDYVVASVHTHFNLSEEEQTARICKALSHPATTILGHATGRLLLRRPGYKLDLEKVLQTAKAHGKIIEINAQPSRLDLDWTWVKRAKALGVMLAINPDAHSPEELALTHFGIDVARRGWLTKEDVINAWPLKKVLKYLK